MKIITKSALNAKIRERERIKARIQAIGRSNRLLRVLNVLSYVLLFGLIYKGIRTRIQENIDERERLQRRLKDATLRAELKGADSNSMHVKTFNDAMDALRQLGESSLLKLSKRSALPTLDSGYEAISTDWQCYKLRGEKGNELYFYPYFAIEILKDEAEVYDYGEIAFSLQKPEVTLKESEVPSDCTNTRKHYLFKTKTGEADKRYKDNPYTITAEMLVVEIEGRRECRDAQSRAMQAEWQEAVKRERKQEKQRAKELNKQWKNLIKSDNKKIKENRQPGADGASREKIIKSEHKRQWKQSMEQEKLKAQERTERLKEEWEEREEKERDRRRELLKEQEQIKNQSSKKTDDGLKGGKEKTDSATTAQWVFKNSAEKDEKTATGEAKSGRQFFKMRVLSGATKQNKIAESKIRLFNTAKELYLKRGGEERSKTKERRMLLTRLTLKRESIRQEELEIYGKAPLVFTDGVLESMANTRPDTIKAISALPNVRATDAEKYGAQFLEVINEYNDETLGKTEMSSALIKILKSLENNLIGLSKRNRLLHLPVLRNGVAIDLTDLTDDEGIKRILFDTGKQGRLKLTPENQLRYAEGELRTESKTEPSSKNTTAGAFTARTAFRQVKTKPKAKANQKNAYTAVLPIVREAERLRRESGAYELYAGFPFAEGRLPELDFDIKAPLALFPIIAEKTANEITLKQDRTKSILINTNLIFAALRASGTGLGTDSEIPDELETANFLKELIGHYQRIGLKLIPSARNGFERFTDSGEQSFQSRRAGELAIRNYCVLGRFSLTDTALQKDFAKITDQKEIPADIAELLLPADNLPDEYYAQDIGTIKESEINAINGLNYSQEKALKSIKSANKLVVHGPPGTGKSQTITGVIADAVLNGRSVLMVSEKKAALEVIVSRLGKLSDYSLLIDDAEDKPSFYSQLVKMDGIELKQPPFKDFTTQTDEKNERIESALGRLGEIERGLYSTEAEEIEAYRLFREESRFDLNNETEKTLYQNIRRLLGEWADNLGFKEITELTSYFSDEDTGRLMREWFGVFGVAPSINRIRQGLLSVDASRAGDLCEKHLNRMKGWQSLSAGKRAKEKKAVCAEIRTGLAKAIYLPSKKKEYDAVLEDMDALRLAFKHYKAFCEARRTFESFNPIKLEFASILSEISYETQIPITELSALIKRYYVSLKADGFEAKNPQIFESIERYDRLIHEITDAKDKKQELLKQELYYRLYESYQAVQKSKRYGDYKRLIESARKPSLSRFIGRFEAEMLSGIKIWLMTPDSLSRLLPLRQSLFDLVVFDEASQMYVERSIPALFRGGKILVAGDSKQLRPSSLGFGRAEPNEELLEKQGILTTALEAESLLDLAEARYKSVMLNSHYRSKYEELIAFSNSAFYKNKLLVGPNTEANVRPIEVRRVKNGLFKDRANEIEAKTVAELLNEVLLNRKENETIGIISFSSAQREKIEDAIDAECAVDLRMSSLVGAEYNRKHNGEDCGLFVKNIENVQGDERDIIIFSMGYAPDETGKISRQFGWLNCQNGENRLNVAITRAKKKIYFVTSIEPHMLITDDLSNRGPKLLRSYMEYAFMVSSGNIAGAKAVLKSISSAPEQLSAESESADAYILDMEQRLKKERIACEKNPGLGGFIDLGIKGRDGNFCVAVESDQRCYAQAESARERDYHRRRFLESRGWQVFRLWSTNYAKNKDGELDSLKAYVALTEKTAQKTKEDSSSIIERASTNKSETEKTRADEQAGTASKSSLKTDSLNTKETDALKDAEKTSALNNKETVNTTESPRVAKEQAKGADKTDKTDKTEKGSERVIIDRFKSVREESGKRTVGGFKVLDEGEIKDLYANLEDKERAQKENNNRNRTDETAKADGIGQDANNADEIAKDEVASSLAEDKKAPPKIRDGRRESSAEKVLIESTSTDDKE